MGVLVGLTMGKFLGVTLPCWLMIKLGVATLPAGMTWGKLMGVGLLAGVGFTMSLFITTLAFDNLVLVMEAKIGIFAASIFSGIAGYIVLRKSSSTPIPSEP
jgi:NhaA family Na+:H+ antiporter